MEEPEDILVYSVTPSKPWLLANYLPYLPIGPRKDCYLAGLSSAIVLSAEQQCGVAVAAYLPNRSLN